MHNHQIDFSKHPDLNNHLKIQLKYIMILTVFILFISMYVDHKVAYPLHIS